jgi:hypothetical protein
MPIKPNRGEREDQFISRCIETEVGTYGKETEVATAICYSVWRRDKLEKASGMEKIQEKLSFARDFKGINLQAAGLEDACWPGWTAIGTKDLGGREVPNCVPESENMEVQPQISSTYPGQGPTTSSLQEICPPATTDIALNLKNRKKAIDVAKYGPLNPNEPNEEYWEQKAEEFHSGDIQSAKKALCGNCVFFDITKSVLSCIEKGIGGPYAFDIIEAGQIGYCEAFDFKCAAERTCDAWVVGGPIVD